MNSKRIWAFRKILAAYVVLPLIGSPLQNYCNTDIFI